MLSLGDVRTHICILLGVAQEMSRALFIFAKLNPGLQYVQGALATVHAFSMRSCPIFKVMGPKFSQLHDLMLRYKNAKCNKVADPHCMPMWTSEQFHCRLKKFEVVDPSAHTMHWVG